MKRYLSLVFLLLCCAVGMWAQPNWENQGSLITSPDMVDEEFADGTVFYTIQCKSNSQYIRSNSKSGDHLAFASVTNDGYSRWAILGNNTSGFQFVNKQTKEAIALEKFSGPELTSSNLSNADVSYLTSDLTDANTRFAITTHIKDANYWVISSADNHYYYWNLLSGKLGYWYSGEGYEYGWYGWNKNNNGDLGSSFRFAEVERIEALTYHVTITGDAPGAKITVNGIDYTNGSSFETHNTITADDVVAAPVAGYRHTVAVTGDQILVAYEEIPAYGINFTNGPHSHNTDGRVVSIIKLGDETVGIDGTGNFYQDLTATEGFNVEVGETIKPAIFWNGAWMHGFVYIDTDSSDRQFTESELVSNTALTGSPDLFTGFSEFTAPETPGDYRMRYKVDWVSKDPGGASDLCDNGGYIFDVMLHVATTINRSTVTYVYMYNGEEIDRYETNQKVGSVVAIPTPKPYMHLAYDEDAIVAEDGMTIEVTCTETLPFTVTTDKDHPVTGLLRLNSILGYYAYADQEDNRGKWIESTDLPSDIPQKFYWYITGNIIDGFQFYNLATNKPIMATEGQDYTTFDDDETADINNLWRLANGVKGTQLRDDIFALRTDVDVVDKPYLNPRVKNGVNYVGFWNLAEAGSTFQFVPLEYVVHTYTVSIVGASEASLTYSETTYHDGDTFQAPSLAVSELSASEKEGCVANIRINGTDVIVTYGIVSLDQIIDGAAYAIRCPRSELTINADHSALQARTKVGTEFSLEAEDYQFQFVQHNGQYYLYSEGAKKFVTSTGTLVSDLNEANPVYFRSWGTTCQPYWDDSHNLNINSGGTAIGTWTTQDDGDRYEIFRVDDDIRTLAYTIHVEGVEGQGGVSFNGTEYGDAQQTEPITLSTLWNAEAIQVEAYNSSLSVSENNVTVTYTPWPTYIVSIVGSEEGYLTYDGQTYTNEQTFSVSALDESLLSAGSIDGLFSRITLSDNTISVTYYKDIRKAGTYYATIEARSTARNPFLYNDLTQPDNYTLQAATADPSNNAYIWKIVSDGEGNVSIMNGQGTSIKPNSRNSSGSFSGFRIELTDTENFYYLNNSNFTGSHNRLNCSDSGFGNGNGIRCEPHGMAQKMPIDGASMR